ncbi:hypothetical protein ACFV0T_26620 [Streptomyces sp. NPDC059582]|uniref:hypothetical protein n=1 Tax=Streptomyces sp. NPDC059582 TaxID=3346875 RepID=UPI0036A6D2D3
MASDLRDRLQHASDQLKADGHHDLAAAVASVLAPGGWSKLRAPSGSTSTSNFPIYMPKSLRDALKKAGDDMDVSLGALVTEGFRAAVAGTWVPQAVQKTPKGGAAGTPMANLNVRVDDAARTELEEALPRLMEQVEGRLSLTSIATAWLREELGVEND